jgi:hypothetical protein
VSFPAPAAGTVIAYSFLWQNEAQAGHLEGRKRRPCAVLVVVTTTESRNPEVVVAPITHRQPEFDDGAVELPPRVRLHLGLDGERSWVVLTQFNHFTWPGFDLRSISPDRPEYVYGMLPPAFFNRLIEKFNELRRQRRVAAVSRD